MIRFAAALTLMLAFVGPSLSLAAATAVPAVPYAIGAANRPEMND